MLRDTSAAVRAIQTRVDQRLTPDERLQLAMEMSDFAHRLAEAGVRSRHGVSSDADVRRVLVETLYGQRTSRS